MTSEKALEYMLKLSEEQKVDEKGNEPERPEPTRRLTFGLWYEVPETVTAAWGARWIFPDDQLHDRQDIFGHDLPSGKKLVAWLNGGALRKAGDNTRAMVRQHTISPYGNQTVVLFEDETGMIKGNPNASFGYLYVCAYLKEEVA